MPIIIITPLARVCPQCRARLQHAPEITDKKIALVFTKVGLTLMLGGPIAVYFLLTLAGEVHHAVSIKMILVCGLIGMIPAFIAMKIGHGFKKIATQTCGKCGARTFKMVKVRDAEDE